MPTFQDTWGNVVEPTGDARKAAKDLGEGRLVDWQPGDSTRYELSLTVLHGKRVLICANLRWFAILAPDEMITPNWWTAYGIRGSWAGMRPLLYALGMTHHGRAGSEWVYYPEQVHDAVRVGSNQHVAVLRRDLIEQCEGWAKENGAEAIEVDVKVRWPVSPAKVDLSVRVSEEG